MIYAAESAGKWRELATEFQSLADAADGPQLVADATREKNNSQDVVRWRVHGSVPDTLRERFQVACSEAARAFGASVKDTSLRDMWLHRLYQYLCDENSPLKRESGKSLGIDKVCEASAAFCWSLQKQTLEGEQTRNTLAQRFQAWIVGNFATPDFKYVRLEMASAFEVRGWLSAVARGATTPIPIDFLSARLNVGRVPPRTSEFDSLRALFDQVAREQELMWGITECGLWMAQQPPIGVEFIDSNGRQHGEAAKPRKNEAKVRFNKFAGPLWKEFRQQQKNASIEDLREMVQQIDSAGFVPPERYLEGAEAVKELKARSKKEPIDTWVKLIDAKPKNPPFNLFVTAVRKTLSRASGVC